MTREFGSSCADGDPSGRALGTATLSPLLPRPLTLPPAVPSFHPGPHLSFHCPGSLPHLCDYHSQAGIGKLYPNTWVQAPNPRK